jgi:UDP-glucose 4-epimerase
MKILTTKGVGLIGSNLAKKLFRDNNEILIVDNLWRGKLENLNFNDNNFHIEKNFEKLDLKFIKRESL